MTVIRTADERAAQRIARKVLREMLNSHDHREDIKEVALTYVTNYRQTLYTRKYINIYCRQLAAALRKLP